MKKSEDLKLNMEARYQRAQSLIQGTWSNDIAYNSVIVPSWVKGDDCFWYVRTIMNSPLVPETSTQTSTVKFGKEFRFVDACAASNESAFDHQVLARKLAGASGHDVDHANLPITDLEMTVLSVSSKVKFVKTLRFSAFDQCWEFDTSSSSLISLKAIPQHGEVSPNGRFIVFERNYNLWLQDLDSGEEKPLTHDGQKHYVYGGISAAWGAPTAADKVQVRWSPDSQRIFTIQRDTRHVQTLPIMHHVPADGGLRPTVDYIKVAYPGDEHIETLRLLSIDVATGCIKNADYEQIPVTRNGHGFFTSKLGWWASDSHRAYFVDMARGYTTVRVVEFDTHTGNTRVLFEESSDTHLDLMLNQDDIPILMPLLESNELLWFSERSGWGHLYLYDLNTGKLKNAITKGEWLVRSIAQVDLARREIFVQTGGRCSERDPYYRDLVRVNLDSGEISTVVSSDHEYSAFISTDFNGAISKLVGYDVDNASGVSPSGNFAVLTKSRADQVPESLLFDRYGNQILDLETADISSLSSVTNGQFQWPEPVKLLAADGITDVYGLVFRPSDFSSDQSYPIISHVFSTPDFPWVSKGSFANGAAYGLSYFDAVALAELGFVVVQIDGRGSPFRKKSFHDESYGWAESASNLEDHVAGIQQLAERYVYMDLSRVGITSHMSGGPGSVQGLLEYPEFYKVGVSFCLHDSRLMASSMWGEKFEGMNSGSVRENGGQYPEYNVDKLKGKLLLTHGMLDWCCPPAATLRLVDALQQSNKDFDLILLPNVEHSVPTYVIRRTWDYLVKNLMGVEPPKEFGLTTTFDG